MPAQPEQTTSEPDSVDSVDVMLAAALTALGEAFAAHGRLTEAERLYRRALEIVDIDKELS